MKNKFLLASAVSLVASVGLPQKAQAWGQYGHQQVNDAAVTVLGASNGLGKCFTANRYLLKRAAITPDVEWKADMSLKTLSPEDKAKRFDDDKYEHPMHFDEADAWVPNPRPGDIAKLPAGEYVDVFAFYQDRLQKNASYVTEIDPGKKLKDPKHASVNEVTDHGTAPWRALQLYRLGVEALKKKNVQLAMLYLGTMGHYVGDMSMPFHSSLNYDGGHYARPAAGIHHEIDTGTLPQKGKDENSVYPTFEATEKPVLEAARKALGGSVDGLHEDEIVAEIFKMIDDGYADVEGFLKPYAEECAAAQNGSASNGKKDGSGRTVATAPKTAVVKTTRKPKDPSGGSAVSDDSDPTQGQGGHGSIPSAGAGAYCVTTPATAPGGRPKTRALPAAHERNFGTKVLPAIAEHLGESAALLARIWAAAYVAAGKPTLTGCAEVKFDQSYAIQNYPRPSQDGPHGYLPAGYTPGHRH